MDSEDGSSRSRSEEMEDEPEQETETIEKTELDVNGSRANQSVDVDSAELAKITTPVETIESPKPTATPLKEIASPSEASGGTSSPPLKGFGLKKWRRKRRDLKKDGSSSADVNRILKRDVSNMVDTPKSRGFSTDNKQKSEGDGSVASVNSVAVKDSESRLGIGAGFLVGTDSENSEGWSSKSTGASAPKPSGVVRFSREKNKVKNSSGKSSGNVVIQKVQQGKAGRVEGSKKFRGERVQIDKENSYSSVESDLRSSNVGFGQEGSSGGVVGNGRQSERCSNYDGDNKENDKDSEPQCSEELLEDGYKENGEVKDDSREDSAAGASGEANKEGNENHGHHKIQDPLVESIILLQAAQEALENEIKKFVEMKESISQPDDSSCGPSLSGKFAVFSPKTQEPNSSCQFVSEEREASSSSPLEADLIKLNQKVNLLEHELSEALAKVKAKESKMLELENILNEAQLLKKETESDLKSLQERCDEMESELERLFKEKIEAEVEYLMMIRITQTWKVAAEDQFKLLEEQKSLFRDQAQMVMKLQDAEDKVIKVKKQAEELEASSRELLETEEVMKMQNDVCKLSFCCFFQFILLCIVVCMFLLQPMTHSTGFAPT
eukprot:TRINITY_DN19630_c0_g1_i1.p1 TRINITY_DN19630_c0_g1~~TRINITY_DN19630_c0_g1_i1.p1  ORF type:complete len:611 (-),score=134.29 TRINITY_DN19630_c0_g1_i1:24-1856(-)